MAMAGWLLFTATFLASIVEMVEAVTIILATGITRGWRSALIGAAVGALVLAVITYILGFHLIDYIPLDALRVFIGGFLLIFGLQWIRKAILRYVGMKALHDEDRIFAEDVKALSAAPIAKEGIDWQGFTVAFKGVLLEGLEVAFIVITFGANAREEEPFLLSGIAFSGVGLATLSALSAAALVIVAAVIVHKPLARVPENDMKMAVGLMLVAFGTFWSGEGIGIEWIWGDASIPALIVVYGLTSWAAVVALRKSAVAEVAA